MIEPQTASPELQLFFDRLLAVKQYCKSCIIVAKTAPETVAYDDIYRKLNEIIKDERDKEDA